MHARLLTCARMRMRSNVWPNHIACKHIPLALHYANHVQTLHCRRKDTQAAHACRRRVAHVAHAGGCIANVAHAGRWLMLHAGGWLMLHMQTDGLGWLMLHAGLWLMLHMQADG